MAFVANPGPGRPRLTQRSRRAQTPRAEILDAAAELFTTQGYASTSTRAVADAVGIRQASLYHHFGSKDDILDALLAGTIAAPLALAQRLAGEPEEAAVKLYALAGADVAQLRAARWNLGALYLLPELRTERFAGFRAHRDELRGYYEDLAAAALTAAGEPDGQRILPFRLVETVIDIRSDDGSVPADIGRTIGEAILRIVGAGERAGEIRRSADALLARLLPGDG
ncbi:TetR/AcrR family transcriptional regulator [Nocardia thailandica]